MSKKVAWVVSSGDYSDYRVLCVCDSEKRAERVAERLRGDADGWRSDAFVETLPLVDYEPEKVDVHSRLVNVWDDGTASDEKYFVNSEWPFDSFRDLVKVAWRWVRAPAHNGRGGRLEVGGTDAKLVAKVYGEKRAQALADPAFRARKEAKGRR